MGLKKVQAYGDGLEHRSTVYDQGRHATTGIQLAVRGIVCTGVDEDLDESRSRPRLAQAGNAARSWPRRDYP